MNGSRDLKKAELPEWLEELRAHPLDDEYNNPNAGGCWICHKGNGFEDDPSEYEFSTDLDSFYHVECLQLADENMSVDVETLLDYEKEILEE